MAATGAHLLAAASIGLPPVFRRRTNPSTRVSRRQNFLLSFSAHRSTNSADASITSCRPIRRADMEEEEDEDEERCAKSLKDFFEEARDLTGEDGGGGGGPPRWFSPLECGARCHDDPLLLYLPGIDGVGLGLIRQHRKLGRMFNIWCLHIPATDRTAFRDLVKMVERTVRSDSHGSLNRPIYLVGESLGACIALAVAASNPDIDLVLILANPATSFGNSLLRAFMSLVKTLPYQLRLTIPFMLSLMTGAPLKRLINQWVKGLPLEEIVGRLYQDLVEISTYNSVLADILGRETLLWKLQLLDVAAAYANANLHFVKAQTLILSSGRDTLLPSQDEGKRLRQVLPNCEIRTFKGRGHFLFLEDGIDLATILKGTYFYRLGKYHDVVFDYAPITISEFNKLNGPNRLFEVLTGSVFLSTKEDGKIVRGLDGIPSEGPVLVVGNHLLLASDVVSMPGQIFAERNIILRGIGHPLMFTRLKEGWLPDVSAFDTSRLMGIVPVSGNNLYNLLSSKSHVLMHPGGIREALHRKGEEHKLFWPENPEFVRMAAKFGAKIIPFGIVGEDDVFKEFFDYNDQIKIPFLKSFIESLTNESEKLRPTSEEVGNQDLYFPGILPKLPGRFYYYFGKPIKTKGREQVLTDREKSRELYLEVKSDVERCIAFLKEKREHDPYRGLLPRLQYQLAHGFESEVPTFEF